VRFKTRPSWAASAEPDALTLGLNVGCAVTVTGARRRRLPLSAGFTASSATACRVKASAAGRRGLTVDDEVVVYCPIGSSSARGLWSLGSRIMGASLVNYFSDNGDKVLVAHALRATPLGPCSPAFRTLTVYVRTVRAAGSDESRRQVDLARLVVRGSRA
jgi:hypothetical protein